MKVMWGKSHIESNTNTYYFGWTSFYLLLDTLCNKQVVPL